MHLLANPVRGAHGIARPTILTRPTKRHASNGAKVKQKNEKVDKLRTKRRKVHKR
jgi:hypothetical protein